MTATATASLKLIKEYGVNGLLVIAVIWMNSRLNNVETRLFQCMDARVVQHSQKKTANKSKILAVLPEKVKVKKSI